MGISYLTRIHINMDIYEYKLFPAEMDEDGQLKLTNLLTYKGQTMEFGSGYDNSNLLISLLVDSPKLTSTEEKRSYMMVAITAVLLKHDLKGVQAENEPSSPYHRFTLIPWVLSVRFSLLVQTGAVVFRGLKLISGEVDYDTSVLLAKNTNNLMNNLAGIVQEINEVYQAFKTFKQYEE